VSTLLVSKSPDADVPCFVVCIGSLIRQCRSSTSSKSPPLPFRVPDPPAHQIMQLRPLLGPQRYPSSPGSLHPTLNLRPAYEASCSRTRSPRRHTPPARHTCSACTATTFRACSRAQCLLARTRLAPRRGARAMTRRASISSASSRTSRHTVRRARSTRRARGSVRVALPERPHTCRPADARVTGAIPRLACPSVSRERTMAPRRLAARPVMRAFEPADAPDDARAPHACSALTRATQARSCAGYGFDLVSLPKYAYEALAWTTVAAIPGSGADACPAREARARCGSDARRVKRGLGNARRDVSGRHTAVAQRT
jgi:hypothetical protein